MKNFPKIIHLTLCLLSIATLAQSEKLNTTNIDNLFFDRYRPELYEKIIPNDDIDYVYFEVRGDRGYEVDKLITSIGSRPKRTRMPDRKADQFGFFNCEDVLCSTYIIAVTSNRTVELINTEKLLIKFLGTIDNLEETYLLNLANEYIDNEK